MLIKIKPYEDRHAIVVLSLTLDLQQNTGQNFKQPVGNSQKGKDSLTPSAYVGDCTILQYIQKWPV